MANRKSLNVFRFIWEHQLLMGPPPQLNHLHLLQPPTPPGWNNRKLNEWVYLLVQVSCCFHTFSQRMLTICIRS